MITGLQNQPGLNGKCGKVEESIGPPIYGQPLLVKMMIVDLIIRVNDKKAEMRCFGIGRSS